jgi:shikimate dehydrogenase
MRLFGLIGYPLGHSFSRKYFTNKFEQEQILDAAYELFEIPTIDLLPEVLQKHPNLRGLNVTVPYKQAVMPYLDNIDPAAARIGAVNTILISDGRKTGYNSDYVGFLQSLLAFYPQTEKSAALVLGTGGAAKAVMAALDSLGIPFQLVSRAAREGGLSYADLGPDLLLNYPLIINTTPLGMHPRTEDFPELPYEALTDQHYLYDLVYNPAETTFMKKGAAAGAKVKNGYDMLVLQAEESWRIWNS